MNLPFLKNFNKKILPSYFLVLILRDEKVNAVVFEELEGKIKIVGQSEKHFSASIDDVPLDDFLQILDKAISHAESTLPENIQTQKTIFGVKESWTDNDQIKREYLVKLKKVSEELGLMPIGFLVNSQAIVHLLQKEEGAPISAILAEVNQKTVTVTLIRAGKIIETKSSQIHETIPFTVDTLLKHFNIPEILPSRIILFNGKEDLSQEFIKHTWSKSLPFLHFPQITNLPYGFDAKAVLFGAAVQMGFEVLGRDLPRKESVENQPAEIEKLSDFGFAKDMDVAKIPAPRSLGEVGEFQEEITPAHASIEEDSFVPKPNPIKNFLLGILSTILIFLKKISLQKILTIFSKMPRGKVTVFLPLILFFIIGLIFAYFFLLKATIQITVDPKIIEQNRNVLFSAISETNTDKNIIKGEFVSASEDGSVSTSATGKKDVGTKAKGTVTVFNNNISEITFLQGTTITSSNNLGFTFDSSVKVASASSDPFQGIKPSTKDVNVTASLIGPSYNLPSNTKFSLENTSLVAAKNDNPFGGGTKKEVTVVSEKDLEKLENDLSKQLENKAKEVLIKKIDPNKTLLPVFISSSLSKKSFNAELEDEVNQVTLTGTVEYQGISYDKNDLITFSKSLLEKDIPKDQEIDFNNIKTDVKDISEKGKEEIEASLSIKALLLPKIDEEKLTKDSKGKSFKNIEDAIYKLPQVSDVDILLSPKIPFLPKFLPLREKNIKVQIKING